jgi:hypothetical protein
MKSSQEHGDASAEWLDSVEVRLIREHERERRPNLASNVLALALRRLPRHEV